MALQEMCGFQNSHLDLQWNSSFLSSTYLDNTFPLLGYDSVSRWLQGTCNSVPMEFYVPVSGYLTDSPIEFGQVHLTLNSPWKDKKTNDHFHDSLPSISMNTPMPLSVSPSVPLPFPLGHGTTTLGFVFQGGVIAAADSRSSCGGLVACPRSQKILPVHSHLVGTTSGTSADCALWKRILARELRLYQLRYKRRLSTGGAAKLLSHMLHPFKGTELCVAATLCGWDGEEKEIPSCTETSTAKDATSDCPDGKIPMETSESYQTSAVFDGGASTLEKSGVTCQSGVESDTKTQLTAGTGPQVVYVCSDGLRLKGELFSVGSGSPYAYSILDGRIHWGMSVDEAVSVAREAVYRATHRDAYSGNNVDLYLVNSKGWTRRKREDLKEEYYREKERKSRKVEERKHDKRQKHLSGQSM